MLTGTVTDNREIVIQLEVIGADHETQPVQAIIDSGFNGFLTLPTGALIAVGASSAGTRRAELGDGNTVAMDVYFVKVRWHNEEREILALQADAAPLVGMSLLWGSRVVFDAQDGGAVTIGPIP